MEADILVQELGDFFQGFYYYMRACMSGTFRGTAQEFNGGAIRTEKWVRGALLRKYASIPETRLGFRNAVRFTLYSLQTENVFSRKVMIDSLLLHARPRL